jgi:hypothetical protein
LTQPFQGLRNGVRPRDAHDIKAMCTRGFGKSGLQRRGLFQKSRSA